MKRKSLRKRMLARVDNLSRKALEAIAAFYVPIVLHEEFVPILGMYVRSLVEHSDEEDLYYAAQLLIDLDNRGQS